MVRDRRVREQEGRRIDRMRRRVLAALCGLLGVGLARRARADDGPKLTRAEAEYQDTPKDIRMCATCSLFLPPKACKVVAGDVKPEGWCKLFELAD
jgi:hypothetical protein